MFPILFSLGQIQLRTETLFFILAFLVSAFIFWKKGREEHYSETQLFDGFLLAVVFGFLVSRVGYIVVNFPQFEWNVIRWLDVFAYPGSHLVLGLLGSTLYIAWFAQKKKWDVFEILDFWVLATALSAVLRYFGYFFDGTVFGNVTNLPWGIIFPGVFEKRHPLQLYFAIFYLLLFVLLSRAEYRYRTYEWYRAGKKTAQTGFLISVFIIGSSFFSFLMSFLQPADFSWGGIVWDPWIYMAVAIFGVILLIKRSGRELFPSQKRKAVFPNEK